MYRVLIVDEKNILRGKVEKVKPQEADKMLARLTKKPKRERKKA